jgi:hypothetical protein
VLLPEPATPMRITALGLVSGMIEKVIRGVVCLQRRL